MSATQIDRTAARAAGLRRGRSLEYLTIGWNLLEGLVAVGSGLVSRGASR